MGVEAPMLCKGAKSVPCFLYVVGVEAPMLGKEQNLSLVQRMSWVWRHTRFAKEQNLSLAQRMTWVT